MTWVKTVEGKLLNLNTISTIEVTKPFLSSYQLIAKEPTVRGNNHYLVSAFNTEQEAEAALDVLQKLLGAETIEEFVQSVLKS